MNDFCYIPPVKPNVNAEQAVIGAILVDADRIMPQAEEMLTEGDFLISEYRTLFRTCSGYFVDGKAIDVVTLLAQHGDAYKVIIIEALQAMPSIHNWKAYAQIVMDTAKRYRAREIAVGLVEALCDPAAVAVEECLGLAVKTCEQLSTTTSGNTVSAKEGFYQFYAALQKPVAYIPTGFGKLDHHTFIAPGDFVVIGARPSVGKTALTLQMMTHMSKSRKVAYFSLETRNHNLFGRMVSNLSGETLKAIKTRNSLDYARVLETQKIFDTLAFHTVEAAGWSVAQIKAKAVQLGAEIIFVDYMGLVQSEGSGRYEKMTNISIDLHTMAQQSGITVIGLSQLNRQGQGEPTMEALRESGQIEQDADIILLLHAPDEIDGATRTLYIAKNKEGQTGKVTLGFCGEIQRFSGFEERYAN